VSVYRDTLEDRIQKLEAGAGVASRDSSEFPKLCRMVAAEVIDTIQRSFDGRYQLRDVHAENRLRTQNRRLRDQLRALWSLRGGTEALELWDAQGGGRAKPRKARGNVGARTAAVIAELVIAELEAEGPAKKPKKRT
jgi:hypothetical protein